MASKDLYSSLQKIASESMTSSTKADNIDTEMVDAQDIAKISSVKQLAERMYPNDKSRQLYYLKKNVDIAGMSNAARNEYWKTYETIHPRGRDGATSDLVNTTLNEVGMISGVSNKEFFLRDRMASVPPWASAALEPELAKVSTVVATANFSKANQVYTKTVQDKLGKFLTSADLDPDVSVDQHTADFLKLEQMNLFDVASVVNGRIGAYDPSGKFVPGFGIDSRSRVMPNDPYGSPSAAEQTIVKDTAAQPIKEAIETKIYSQRKDIARQEVQSAMQATKLLETGHYSIDRWNEAFSINPESDPMSQIQRGLKGEIAAGRIKNEKDLEESIYTAMSKYPSMFGELNNG